MLSCKAMTDPVSILRKSISGRHRPVRVADVDLRRMPAGELFCQLFVILFPIADKKNGIKRHATSL